MEVDRKGKLLLIAKELKCMNWLGTKGTEFSVQNMRGCLVQEAVRNYVCRYICFESSPVTRHDLYYYMHRMCLVRKMTSVLTIT